MSGFQTVKSAHSASPVKVIILMAMTILNSIYAGLHPLVKMHPSPGATKKDLLNYIKGAYYRQIITQIAIQCKVLDFKVFRCFRGLNLKTIPAPARPLNYLFVILYYYTIFYIYM